MTAVPPRLLLPAAPALVAGCGRAGLVTVEGEILVLAAEELPAALGATPPLVVHAPATWRRLGLAPRPAFDLLELFAFVLPARFAAPSPRGLASVLDLEPDAPTLANQAALLPAIARALLSRLAAARKLPLNRHASALAARLALAGWAWAPAVLAALGTPHAIADANAFRVWRRLPEWEEEPPRPPPSAHPIAPGEARRRLADLLGAEAEHRQGQADFASAATAAFAPRAKPGAPRVVLAEAGTGTGKTLGYIAPASLWAERNRGTVWISTFTRHLQRQIETELSRLGADPAERRRRVVLRKGRENYLCLLNLETVLGFAQAGGGSLIPLALILRWAEATADGDIMGGDLPGWFADLFGAGVVAQLADRRGECIYAACPHWRRCFIEHGIRRARNADLVVANHALVMAQAAWGGLDEAGVPTRYVFDEGHHLFAAADSAFAVILSGAAMAELRRWLLGAEGMRSRSRGLSRRLEDLLGEIEPLAAPLSAVLAAAARALPAPGWTARLGLAEEPALALGFANPAEDFLHVVRRQVLARSRPAAGSSAECELYPVDPPLIEMGARLEQALGCLAAPLAELGKHLARRLKDEAEEIDSAIRGRIEAAARTLARRAIEPVAAWRRMLSALAEPRPEPGQRSEQVLLLRLEREEKGERDAALAAHWLDPTMPFAAVLAEPAHGLLITSATLRDGAAEEEMAWRAAEARTGAAHLPLPPIRALLPSSFDYAAQTRVFLITDVNSRDITALAGAYRALFLAAGGGALGLFTAISRLRAVYALLAPALAGAGLPLYAQHVDAMDNASLVEVFRAEEESCLLGTDAMRDGVDVPGMALRLVVFERIPWPRPDILHRARRTYLSEGQPREYDFSIARLRLRQAFGRLIRRQGDRGVFVLLGRAMPSQLAAAFPSGVQPLRTGLAAAVREVRFFLAP